MKERLTGAIILVAVLVLLVPELLSGPEQYTMQPGGAEGSGPLRSYTIDLADDASRRAMPPTSAPSVATDDPVVAATPEPELAEPDDNSAVVPDASAPAEGSSAESVASASGSGAADARREAERGSGSGADQAAAAPPSASANRDATKVDGNAARGASPGAEDDQPRSAFGPNAVQRPKPDASSATARNDSASSARSATASAASGASTKGESTKGASTREADRDGGSSKAASAETRPAAKDSKVTKGWAVQLGVFASRDNADRLAKQVKGKGYTVSVNETSGNGKRLYRVRVGPEASRTAAVELGAKLRAAGYTGSVVAWP